MVSLACTPAASQPSRHLLLGNVSSRPNESALETVFGKFGPLDSVKVFPGKTYALVSFKDLAPAAEAMQCLDGHSLLSVSGHSLPTYSLAWLTSLQGRHPLGACACVLALHIQVGAYFSTFLVAHWDNVQWRRDGVFVTVQS